LAEDGSVVKEGRVLTMRTAGSPEGIESGENGYSQTPVDDYF
jgi:hypothetical protein